MKKVIPIFSLAILLSACSFHTGNISSGSPMDCPIMYIASGTASTTRFLEIGGNKNALIIEAKNDLYRKFPYIKGIKLSNFSVDYKNTFFLFFHTTRVTVSADVYNCNIVLPDTVEDKSVFRVNGFKIGDEVFIESYLLPEISSGKIMSHLAGNMVLVVDGGIKLSSNGSTFSYSSIFRAVKDPENVRYFGIDIGEKFPISVVNYETGIKYKTECTVIGINHESAIVEFITTKGKTLRMSIEKEKLHQ